MIIEAYNYLRVSTHSRPKAAAYAPLQHKLHLVVSTHSRPKAAANECTNIWKHKGVSTHSRPKAAAITGTGARNTPLGFNTQPPEGGCI